MQDGSRRPEDVQWHRVQGQGLQWGDSDEDEEPALYRTDEFRIRVMKVLRCSKKYCHDWTRCPFAHPGEKATRRDPSLGIYTGIACPDMKKDQRCPRGHYCPYAHNVFEYWLHPTRYRTALCRDVERCTRKICFFAHEVREIRTNVERPYVSPELLAAATEAAAADPRVQAEYHAAGDEQRRSSKPGLMTGLFNSLDEPSESELNSEPIHSLNLSLPNPSKESQEVMQALGTLMRGDMGALTNSYASGNAGLPRGPESLVVTGPGGLPSLDQRVRRVASEPSSRQRSAETLRHAANAQVVSTISEGTPSMFPDHLNTMVQVPSHQSPGSQQNLMNAAAHLLSDGISGKEPSIWSTPRSPLEPLFSTTSTLSDRASVEAQAHAPGRLESAYKQKYRKRSTDKHAKDVTQLYSNGYTNPTLFPGGVPLEMHPVPNPYGLWTADPHLEYARAMQQQRAIQTQAYLQSVQDMHAHQQHQVYQQELRLRNQQLQQAFQAELQNHNTGRSRQAQSQTSMQRRPLPETGFDLRVGGLGENQGLFSQPQPAINSAHPHLLHSTAAMLLPGLKCSESDTLPLTQGGSGPKPGMNNMEDTPGGLDPPQIPLYSNHKSLDDAFARMGLSGTEAASTSSPTTINA